MRAQDALHHREAQTAPHELGRVERVEGPGLCLRGHAAARVGHFQVAVFARRQIEFALRGGRLPDVHLPGADRDLARVALERFRRVRDQVQDDLPDLRRVRLDRGQVLTQVDVYSGRSCSAAA